ncbi:hypothetical protein H9P43_006067 [Blastocladiella emersonii ATCC 22665]|nr:hypothetical protein H9P43_006067 [Blastocladiella emersonii ATCC 22665]
MSTSISPDCAAVTQIRWRADKPADPDCCKWAGIKCELNKVTELNQVTEINLNNKTLSGPIPRDLGKLSVLRILALGVNELGGSIPSELGDLRYLETLALDQNKLGGQIPRELGNLARLKVLALYNNMLTGAIPTELGNLGALENLSLEYNSLSKSIPASFGNLTKVTDIYLNNNRLSGEIPRELAKLKLEKLVVKQNALTGPVEYLPAVSTNCELVGTDETNTFSCFSVAINSGPCYTNLNGRIPSVCPVASGLPTATPAASSVSASESTLPIHWIVLPAVALVALSGAVFIMRRRRNDERQDAPAKPTRTAAMVEAGVIQASAPTVYEYRPNPASVAVVNDDTLYLPGGPAAPTRQN